MPIIRRKLDPNTVYPTDIQYNPETDTVQRKIGGSWVDSTESDPRHATTLPPRLTADPACDAAQSVADAFKGQIDQILTAIDNGQTAFSIAALILGLFTFGVFDIFIAIALGIGNAMLDAGTTALEASLTPAAYHSMVCALSCNMDTQGRITAGGLAAAQDQITSEVGGVGAVTLNSMLSLAGEGGVNNIASLGTATGDCDDCGCVERWCAVFDFSLSDGGWSGPYGAWSPGGWQGSSAGTGVSIVLDRTIPTATFTHIDIDCQFTGTGNIAVVINGVALVNELNVASGTYTWDGTASDNEIVLNPSSGATQGANVTMSRVLFKGTGTNPFGADNCTP